MQVSELDAQALNAPQTLVESTFSPDKREGVVKYRKRFSNSTRLDALVLNKHSDVLVVSFHGALMRKKYHLPRFEWLSTLRNAPFSSMFVSDPSLHLSKTLQLAWFTGWREVDIHKLIAEWAQRVAEASGASRIIFTGSSGGGFASLQTSHYVPGSIAAPFNAQTDIAAYLVAGSKYTAQLQYLEAVWPDVYSKLKNKTEPEPEWKLFIDDRVSAVDRYRTGMNNYIYFTQNTNDFHYENHFAPLKQAILRSHNHGRFVENLYEGEHSHRPPSKERFLASLMKIVDNQVSFT